MRDESVKKLLMHARRIDELQTRMVEVLPQAIENKDFREFAGYAEEFRELKKSIKLETMEWSALEIPGEEYGNERRIIQSILLGLDLPIEEVFAESNLTRVFRDELDSDELEDWASGLFYSWFSGEDYVLGLYEIGSLVAKIGEFPEYLSHFVNSARQAFALQQYLAVFALCRTALEIAMRDVFLAEGLHDTSSESFKYVERHVRPQQERDIARYNPSLFQQMVMLCVLPEYRHLEAKLHDVRGLANSLIHGNRVVSKQEATKFLVDTFQVIHDLYEAG